MLGIADLEDVAHRTTYFTRLHREDHVVPADLEEYHLRTQRRFEYEYRVQRKDGEYAWIHDRSMPEFDCQSEPAFHECLLRLTNENGEMISAGMFLPIVEQMGLARPPARSIGARSKWWSRS